MTKFRMICCCGAVSGMAVFLLSLVACGWLSIEKMVVPHWLEVAFMGGVSVMLLGLIGILVSLLFGD